jgi:Uma2 family endonuclease
MLEKAVPSGAAFFVPETRRTSRRVSTLALHGYGGEPVLVGSGTANRWLAPEGPWTEPDLHLFPQDGHRYEIVDGALHVSPPLTAAHAAAVQALVSTLRSAAPEGWWVCDRLGVAVGGSNLIPDVTVLRPQSSGAIWCNPRDVALVVEVEDPASRRYNRLLKPSLYAEAGIRALWRVELTPAPQIHVYALTNAGYTLDRTVTGPTSDPLDRPFPVRLSASTLT